MKRRQQACLRFITIFALLATSAGRADGTGIGNDSDQVPKLTKDEYLSEVMKLETWKAKAQDSESGKKLMSLLTSLDAAIVRNSRDSSALYARGYLYGTVGCTKAALVDLSKAIQANAMSSNLYTERGICYMDMQEYEKAASDLDQAVAINPRSGDARLARARLNLLLKKPGMALPDLLSCRSENMEFSPVLPGELPANFYHAPEYYLGECYEMLDNHEEAIKYFAESEKFGAWGSNGYIHRYADQPLDASDRISKLQGGTVQ